MSRAKEAPNRAKDKDSLVLGGEPRVDLLPPEIKAARKAKAVRRGLAFGVLGALVVVSAGIVFASWLAAQSQEKLSDAQARTATLLAEQTKYVEVRKVQEAVDTAIDARELGASTEIDWRSYLESIRAILPGDVTIDSVVVDSASPLVPYQAPSAPLQEERIGTLRLTLGSPSLPAVPEWLNMMKTLPGFADATPDSITQSDTGAYVVELTMHINEAAYSQRFASTESE